MCLALRFSSLSKLLLELTRFVSTLPPFSFVALEAIRVYFAGPSPGAEFAVDDASVIAESCECSVPMTSREVIEQIRKSDINIE